MQSALRLSLPASQLARPRWWRSLRSREQVCRMRHPEVTQAVNETLELLRKAGVVINDVILSKLGVRE